MYFLYLFAFLSINSIFTIFSKYKNLFKYIAKKVISRKLSSKQTVPYFYTFIYFIIYFLNCHRLRGGKHPEHNLN